MGVNRPDVSLGRCLMWSLSRTRRSRAAGSGGFFGPPTLHRGPDEPQYFADHRRRNPLYRKGVRCNYTFGTGTQIYDSQRVACESSKAAERAQCEAREQFCFSVAKVCSDDREKAAASNIEGTLVLWVDDHPDNNLYERQAFTELGVRSPLPVILKRHWESSNISRYSRWGVAKLPSLMQSFQTSPGLTTRKPV